VDTRYLQYILTIARKQNMTKAAEELFVSQSSLSQYLTKLEQEIGVPLFERRHNRLTLTQAGKMYVDAAEKVLAIKRNLYEDIRSLNNMSHINLGVTSQLALRMLTTVVPAFKNRYPNAAVEITEGNLPGLTRMLQEEKIDCAVIVQTESLPVGMGPITPLGEEEILLAVPVGSPFCRRHKEDIINWNDVFDELGQENFLLSKKGSTLREAVKTIFTIHDFEPHTMIETNSIVTMRAMVAMGIGVTFIGKSCLQDEDKIRYYRLSPRVMRQFSLVKRKSWVLHEAEEHLCREIENYFAQPSIQSLMHYD
jgi:DNA-binding transcriptional LysR family regulator